MTLLLLLMFAVFTQSAAPQQSSQVEGFVTSSDGSSPVAGARVVLRKEQSVRSEADYGTQTSADGHFVFKDVAPGRYRLRVRQAGYVDAEYGQKHPGRPGSILDLSAAPGIGGIRIQMTPGGVVSGRVYDDSGKPMESVQVQLLQPRYSTDGRVLALMAATTQTNDLGEFRLFWIAPGTYYLAATNFNRNSQSDTAMNEQFEGAESIFVPTFYPNALDEAHAVAIKVEAGGEGRSLDIMMTRQKAVHVRGQIIDGMTGEAVPGARVSVRLKQEGWANLGSFASTLSGLSGEFDLRRVAPGTNTVMVMMGMPGGRQVSNYTDVQVADRDIQDLRLILRPPASISGRIIFENGQPPGSASLTFLDMGSLASFGTAVTSNGAFNLTAIQPGAYRLAVNGFGDGVFIRSAYSGSRDALREGIDTTSGTPESLEIRLAAGAATVRGTVTDDRGSAGAGVPVALVPDADRATRPDLFRDAMTDQTGRFTIRGVPPGNYKLFAWTDIEPGIYHDPSFLSQYESLGTPIQIGEGDSATANIRVIP